jgi:hypothetical protein
MVLRSGFETYITAGKTGRGDDGCTRKSVSVGVRGPGCVGMLWMSSTEQKLSL